MAFTITPRRKNNGVIAIGYADGFRRVEGNHVLIRGKTADVVGAVCMDQCMVRLEDISDAEVGDEVILIGAQGEKRSYHPRESERLQGQAGTLVDLLHSDTSYPVGSMVLEAGCGVGAQTVTLARNSPGARFTSIDVSADSLKEAKAKAGAAGLTNVQFRQGG